MPAGYETDERLRSLLIAQAGLVTRAQLAAAGCSEGMIRWSLSHRWRAVLPSVISTTRAPLAQRQRLVAALLHSGEGSVIGCVSAANWHGVTAALDARVHVLAPASRHPRSSGFVVVHRTHRPDVRPWQHGVLAIASRARAIVCEAVERRLVRPEDLRHELECAPRAGSARVRRAVQDAEAGAWSVPEGDLLRLLRGSSLLPAAWANPDLRLIDGTVLPTPDAWIDPVALAIQVHSRRWHSAPDQWTATVMSDGVFTVIPSRWP